VRPALSNQRPSPAVDLPRSTPPISTFDLARRAVELRWREAARPPSEAHDREAAARARTRPARRGFEPQRSAPGCLVLECDGPSIVPMMSEILVAGWRLILAHAHDHVPASSSRRPARPRPRVSTGADHALRLRVRAVGVWPRTGLRQLLASVAAVCCKGAGLALPVRAADRSGVAAGGFSLRRDGHVRRPFLRNPRATIVRSFLRIELSSLGAQATRPRPCRATRSLVSRSPAGRCAITQMHRRTRPIFLDAGAGSGQAPSSAKPVSAASVSVPMIHNRGCRQRAVAPSPCRCHRRRRPPAAGRDIRARHRQSHSSRG